MSELSTGSDFGWFRGSAPRCPLGSAAAIPKVVFQRNCRLAELDKLEIAR